MQHEEHINAAYAETIQSLYKIMMSSYSFAKGDAQLERKADGAFEAGVALARRVRERAVALVPAAA